MVGSPEIRYYVELFFWIDLKKGLGILSQDTLQLGIFGHYEVMSNIIRLCLILID